MTRSERWILSEFIVARDRCERRGNETLLAHRERTPYAEIDLLTRSSRDGLINLIEVKSVVGNHWSPEMLHERQLRRLRRACGYIEERFETPVRLLLATVDPREKWPRYFDLASTLY